MDLPQIAFQDGWRALVTPSLLPYLTTLEAQGVTFQWVCGPDGRYLFSSAIQPSAGQTAELCSWDGSETPRYAVGEVILGTMSVRGHFGQLDRKAERRGRPLRNR